MSKQKIKSDLTVTKALVYCRVSSAGQRTQGHGLESQEQRCREFAEHKGLQVERVFLDTITGNSGYEEREAMSQLMKYLDTHAGTRYAVIFDDIKRLARNTGHHLKLRMELRSRDVVPLSPNFTFEDSAEGDYVETIVAATAELERKQNARQVRQKTESMFRSGSYAFVTPRGYKRMRDTTGQVCHIKNEPDATIIQQALEGYAGERFKTKADVYHFLIENNFNKGKVKEEYVNNLLKNILYTGYFTYEKWGMNMLKLRVEPLISLDTYKIIQERLNSKERTTLRKDIREEFPLRGLLLCGDCKKPLTASTTYKKKGYTRDYYSCKTKDCTRYGKSIHSDRIHTDFDKLMATFTPKNSTLELARFKFEEQWNKREQRIIDQSKKVSQELKVINDKIESFLSLVSKTSSERLITEYEKRLESLYAEKEILASRSDTSTSDKDFGTALKLVMGVFESPYDYYRSGDVYDKRLAFELVFAQKIPFHHIDGFRTTNYTDVVKVFQQITTETPAGCAVIEEVRTIFEKRNDTTIYIPSFYPTPEITTSTSSVAF